MADTFALMDLEASPPAILQSGLARLPRPGWGVARWRDPGALVPNCPPEYVGRACYREIPDDAALLWGQVLGDAVATVDDGAGTVTYSRAAVDRPLSEARAALIDEIAAKRFEVEFAGFTTAGGMFVRTDTRTRAVLTRAALQARDNPSAEIDWKLANGVWVVLDAPTVLALDSLVDRFITECFAVEKAKATAAGAAASVAALRSLRAAIADGWPDPTAW